MTRLFMRFYLLVIVTAVVTLVAVSALLLESTRAHDDRVVEDALHGGAALVARVLADVPPQARARSLRELSVGFRHPLTIVPWQSAKVPQAARERLSGPRGIALFSDNDPRGDYVAVPLVRAHEILVLGPLPDFALPSPLPLLVSFAVIMAISALCLGLAFRPLLRELRALELTAERLSRGEFAARVEGTGPASLPLARALNRMAAETQRLVEGQRELLHMVSHELRTPIARLRFALELLDDAKADSGRAAQLQAVDADVDALETLVDELLTYARLEHAPRELELAPIDVQHVLSSLAAERVGPDKSLRAQVQSGPALFVRGDLRLFRRAIGNLIDNALRHARRQVYMSCVVHGQVVRVYVDDDGPGIDIQDRERAFAPFARLGNQGPGSGLGLAIARGINEWHGGRMCIETSPAGGARLTSEWPVSESPAP